ncbi:MAG: polyphosphate kinase 2 family protein [bacterium]
MRTAKHFAVRPGQHLRLKDVDPDCTDGIRGRDRAELLLQDNIKRLNDLQYRLYAEHRQSLLIILQGMDASGKDGTIRHVMSGLNPQGCNVCPFKAPSPEELSHDYLWRIHRALPARGHIGIFNRSHYEDVLAVRVHNLAPVSVWSRRYEQINRFEKMLVEEGTTILKFFLHISSDEQKRRLQDRLADPSKNWKFTMSDIDDRSLWKDYQEAYVDVLRRCSTPWAQWYVIPANHKWFRNVTVSTIICDTLKAMDPRIPRPKMDLRRIRIT